MHEHDPSLCPGCGAPNRCAVAQGADPAACWCARTEPLLPMAAADSVCYCPSCLQRIAAAQTAPADPIKNGK